VHGTHAGAPHEPQMKKRILITSAVAFVLWVIIAYIISSGMLTVRDLDWFGRMAPRG
jgi:predicted secreted protein